MANTLKNPSDLIRYVRAQVWLNDVNQISDETILLYANVAYDRVINIINQNISDEYFADIFSRDFIAWQNEYSIPKQTSDQPWMNRVNWVSVNYKTNWTDLWIRAKNKEFVWNQLDFAEMEKQYTKDNPIYCLYDTSIFIFPSPTVSVAKGIKLYWSIDALPVTWDDTIWFVVERNWIRLIAIDVMIQIQQSRLKVEEKAILRREYEDLKEELINNYNERDKTPVIRELSMFWWYNFL